MLKSRLLRQEKNTFYCFSPPVMVVTFLIEVVLAVYLLFRYGLKSTVHKLIFTVLVLLAAFQGVEFFICQSYGYYVMNNLARLGLIIITLLPALGIHLSSAIIGRKKKWYIYVAYVLGGMWIVYLALFAKNTVTGICGANYAIMDLPLRSSYLYGLYYYVLLVVGLWEAYSFAHRKRYKKYRLSLLFLVVGYLVFMVPSSIVIIIHPQALIGIPSIMCGFAVALAIILVGFVLPAYEGQKLKE